MLGDCTACFMVLEIESELDGDWGVDAWMRKSWRSINCGSRCGGNGEDEGDALYYYRLYRDRA